ncbi:unnamed protein product, partial [Ixodes hexagonus]
GDESSREAEGVSSRQREISRAMFWFTSSVLAVIIGTIVLVAFVVPVSQKKMVLNCETSECLAAHTYLHEHLDSSIHPCDDFYGYVCRKWIKDSEGVSFLQDALERFLVKISAAMQSYKPVEAGDLHYVLERGRQLLNQCFEFMQNREPSLERDLPSAMELMDIAGILASTSSLEALRRTMALSFGYNIRTIVGLRPLKLGGVVYLQMYSGAPIRSELWLEVQDHELESYFENLTNLLLRKRDDPSLAATLVRMDREVSLLLERPSQDRWFTADAFEAEPDFPRELWETPLKELLSNQPDKATEGAILVTGYDQTRRMISFLQTCPTRFATFYLVIHALADVLRFDLVKRFDETFRHRVRHMCFEAVNRALIPDWSAVIRRLLFTDEHLRKVGALFDNIKRASILEIRDGWMNKFMGEAARAKLDNITLTSHGTLFNDSTRVALRPMSEVASVNETFVFNYISLLKSSRPQRLRLPLDTLQAGLSSLEFGGKAVYSKRHGTVFLPLMFQQMPVFYGANVAPYYDYGTLGAIFARGLSEAIAPFSQWNYSTPSWWTDEALREFSYRIACYRNLHDRVEPQKPHDLDKLTPEVQSSLFAWLHGSRVAYAGMKDNFTRLSTPFQRKRQWKKAQRVFFTRFCLASCGLERSEPLGPREKCIWPLLNMPEFVEAFECPASSFMKLRQKCHLL